MNNNIIITSEDLFKRLDRISKFYSKYNIFPCKQASRLIGELNELANSIEDIENPQNQDGLIQSELKRRLKGEAASLEQRLSGKYYDFDAIISMYAIPIADIEGLRPWLEANRKKTLEAIERLFRSNDVQSYEPKLPVDIPTIKKETEEFTANHIKKYHKRLGRLLQDLTNVGEFLQDINAVPTSEARSYFDWPTNTLAIGIPSICFRTEDGSLHISEKDLILVYGHEIGHALNKIVTNSNGLPYFLTKATALTTATLESVAQFYGNVILEDLKAYPETQRDLGIEDKFDEIYQETKDNKQLKEYQLKLLLYGVCVLADKSLGDPSNQETIKKKVELINEVTLLDPLYPLNFIEEHKYKFDSQGNLDWQLVSELRYAAQPVQRALDEFTKQGMKYGGEGRNKIDATLLNGFWTPIGFVDNAMLRAKKK